ncbi:MAG: thioredoxin family protein [Bacteroidetes bacterium]|nr:thioredoxin family protein [Bacteroidota bacterium]
MKTYVRSILAALAALALLAAPAHAQAVNHNVTWKVLTPLVKGAPGKTVEVKIQAAIAAGSHMYTDKKYPPDALSPAATEVTVGEAKLLNLAGRLKGPRPIRHLDANFDSLTTEYWEGNVTLTVPVKISPKAKIGSSEGWVNFYFMTCDAKSCMSPTDRKLTFAVEVVQDSSMSRDTSNVLHHDTIAAASTAIPDTTAQHPHDTAVASASGTAPAAPVAGKPNTPSDPGAGIGAVQIGQVQKNGSVLALMLLMIIPALGALSTPCVWPMIPITVSFFTKRHQATRWIAVRDAGLYALGIIMTFTTLGVTLTLAFGASGVNDFAAHPITNFIVAAIFLVFALNLFGLFEIQLPTSLLNRLNKEANTQSPWGVIMMGLVFSLTSFTCTFGVIGPLFVSIAGGHDVLSSILGTVAFATVFAAPFFVLALFPSLLKSMPKSGGWLNAVKVVMGFVELAFAFKFIANADIILGWAIFTRSTVLAIWVAVAVLATVYLLGRFMMPHDTPTEKIGPIRLVFAVGFLALGFWLLTGLFGKPLGGLDAQLPPAEFDRSSSAAILAAPSSQQNSSAGSSQGHDAGALEWIQDDYGKALKLARETKRPLFVDFTGYVCTNCRWMEKNMFPRKDVSDLMSKYVLCRLYTDRRDSINKVNQKMLIDRYNTISLPYYVLLTPGDSTVAQFAGMTDHPEDFMAFLNKGLAATHAPLAANTP